MDHAARKGLDAVPPLIAILVALLACKKGMPPPAPSAAPSASTLTAVAPPAPSTSWQPSKEAWCKFVFDTNRKHGHMIGNQYRSNPSAEVIKAVMKEAITNKEEYIAISPLEIRDDVKEQIAYYEKFAAWADALRWEKDKISFPPRPGSGAPVLSKESIQRETRIVRYQVDHCGLNPQPLP